LTEVFAAPTATSALLDDPLTPV